MKPLRRRWRASVLLLLVGLALLACGEALPAGPTGTPALGGADEAPFPSPCDLEALRVGLVPYTGVALDRALQPLSAFLTRHLGVPVDVQPYESYAELTDAIVEGRLDVAVLPPLAWLLARERAPDLNLLATKVSNGAVDYPGYLIGRRTGAMLSLADLRQARVAFVSYESASGFLVSLARLVDAGLDPRTILAHHVRAGSHVEAIRAVLEGRADVAATFRGGIEAARDEGLDTGALRVVGITASIPQDALVGRRDLAPRSLACVRHAFLALSNATPSGRQALAHVAWIEGWVPTDATFYEPLAQILARIRALAPEVSP